MCQHVESYSDAAEINRDGEELDVGAKYPEVCNDNKGTLQPLPAIAAVLRLTPELGIGLSVAPPA